MKKILITNDDGILASGIIRLAEAARAFGTVVVIAPETQRSAHAHSITIREPIDLRPYAFPVPGVTAWTCSGTPSDCVRTGLAYLLPELPDVVLSGINFGYNLASDIQYSGTVGAALEAAHEGIPAIALSEPAEDDHSVTDRYLAQVLSDLLDQKPAWDTIINVNFPPEPCRGILTGRFVSAGTIYRSSYRLEERLPDGGHRITIGGLIDKVSEEGSDLRAVLDQYISIGLVKNVG